MKTIAVLLLAPFLVTACSRTKDRTPIIAVIDGRQVHKSDFDGFLSARLGELTGIETTDLLRSQMLDEFIERQLVLEQAAQAGVSVTQAEIDQATQDNPSGGPARDSAPSRKELVNDLIISKYYKQIVLRDVRPTQEEVQKYLDENHSRLSERAGFVVREIRVEERDRAESLRREAMDGTHDFADLARTNSQAPSADDGGLSRYDEGQLPEVLERAIRPLKPGEVSPVIQSSFGFHLFKLERKIQAHAPEDRRAQIESKRSQLIEELIARKNQEAVDDTVSRLVNGATLQVIDSALGFTYSGRLRHN